MSNEEKNIKIWAWQRILRMTLMLLPYYDWQTVKDKGRWHDQKKKKQKKLALVLLISLQQTSIIGSHCCLHNNEMRIANKSKHDYIYICCAFFLFHLKNSNHSLNNSMDFILIVIAMGGLKFL